MPSLNVNSLLGCLIGTAIGDSLGLPYEGLSPRRALRMFGPPDRHRFLCGRGMVSDDTEQTCMVLQSLLTSGGDLDKFQRHLAQRLRWWLARLPAGTGLATARSILKMWIGYRPPASGVFSAGNGPAMRSAILGVMLPEKHLLDYSRANATITHSDPKATWGAAAVSLAARLACEQESPDPLDYLQRLGRLLKSEPAEEFLERVTQAVTSISKFPSTVRYCESMGLTHGVTGYVYHTVPVALQAWLRYPLDYRSAMQDIIACGGDADTTAAIVGGLVGASVGPAGIPDEWQRGLCDWPLSIAWMQRLAQCAASNGTASLRPPELPLVAQLLRNAAFLPIVLLHGFRRLAPPY